MEQDRVVRDHAQVGALGIANQRPTHIVVSQLSMVLGAGVVHGVAEEVLHLVADAGATGDVGELFGLQRHK